jgi:protein-S-isoprenylcysteine O-methyltransferase Ste14
VARPRFGSRGEGYVAAQLLLLVLVIAGPTQVGAWPPLSIPPNAPVGVAVIVLVAAGAVLLAAGTLRLGSNLTPLPFPKSDGTFVTGGVYRRVRHPLYGGLMLVALGWSLRRGGGLSLLYAGLLVALLTAKSRLEERWLISRYPDYAAYRRRTRRFVPFLW